ncbi:glycosyltransferase family 2 protein [Sphingobacterium multivorum]|uniref:glycosyltransferase family 2 protein n=1 Tax=Sphingobacterium multivorum TaxID=28454 RepID=UPI003DA262A2
MKVSILVPMYNVANYIEKCATSLLEQSYDDIEYIFVDDSSTDETLFVLESTILKYPSLINDIKVVRHTRNLGLAEARNTGVVNANGDYILHVDGDDYIDKDMVSLMINKAIVEQADIVVCDFYFDWGDKLTRGSQSWNPDGSIFSKMLVSYSALPCVWNKLIKRELYEIGKITVPAGLNYGEDLVTIPKLMYFANRVSKVKKALYYYVQSNASSYTKSKVDKNIVDVQILYLNLTAFFKNQNRYDYIEDITIGKIRKRLEFFIEMDYQYWNKIDKLFPECKVKITNMNKFTKREQLMILLLNLPTLFPLRFFVVIYKKIFSNN